ncbi:MAG: M23 family metallopeptidase [Candidatus Cloacimonadales bacterium]
MKKYLLLTLLIFLSSNLRGMSANPRYFTPSEDFHIVQAGDTLASIAQRYNLSVDKLLLYNDLKNDKIFLGQRIYLTPKPQKWQQYITVRDIPQSGYHLVRPKEDIYLIARMYDLEIIDLIDINDLASLDPQPGTKIYLVRSARPKSVPKPAASVDLKEEQAIVPETTAPKPRIISSDSKLVLPVAGKVTSEFGLRNGRPHKGIDIANKKGTPILAALAGKVAYSGRQRGYGNVIILEHANSVMTVYAHNETNLVRVDELVKKGQPIATLGSSGVSSGPHLHFEYREKGRAINPRDLLPQLD